MNYKNSPYFHVGKASDLEGRDRVLYRVLEMVPGFLAWGTILGTVFLSRYLPLYASIFIIIFSLRLFLFFLLSKRFVHLKEYVGLLWLFH